MLSASSIDAEALSSSPSKTASALPSATRRSDAVMLFDTTKHSAHAAYAAKQETLTSFASERDDADLRCGCRRHQARLTAMRDALLPMAS